MLLLTKTLPTGFANRNFNLQRLTGRPRMLKIASPRPAMRKLMVRWVRSPQSQHCGGKAKRVRCTVIQPPALVRPEDRRAGPLHKPGASACLWAILGPGADPAKEAIRPTHRPSPRNSPAARPNRRPANTIELPALPRHEQSAYRRAGNSTKGTAADATGSVRPTRGLSPPATKAWPSTLNTAQGHQTLVSRYLISTPSGPSTSEWPRIRRSDHPSHTQPPSRKPMPRVSRSPSDSPRSAGAMSRHDNKNALPAKPNRKAKPTSPTVQSSTVPEPNRPSGPPHQLIQVGNENDSTIVPRAAHSSTNPFYNDVGQAFAWCIADLLSPQRKRALFSPRLKRCGLRKAVFIQVVAVPACKSTWRPHRAAQVRNPPSRGDDRASMAQGCCPPQSDSLRIRREKRRRGPR